MHKFYLIFFFFTAFLKAQTPIIDSVFIEGNKKAKIQYLERFIRAKKGDRLNIDLLKDDAQNLTNLPSIYDCRYKVDTTNQICNVYYIIQESQTLIPFMNFGVSDEKSSNWILGGITEYNFLGYGIILEGSYQYNKKNTFQILSTIPYIGIGNIGMEINFKKWASIEPLYFTDTKEKVLYDYNNNSFELAFLYHLNLKNSLRISYSFFQEKYERITNKYQDKPGHADELKNAISLQYKWEKVDYFYHLHSGWRFFANTTSVKSNGRTLGDYFQADFKLSYFKRIRKNGNLAMALTMGWANNPDSPFTSFVMDNQINLRGVGDRVARGAAIASFNTEYRFDIYSNNWMAVQNVIFHDVTTIQLMEMSYSNSMDVKNFRNFTGLGLRFILKKVHSAIFRIDFGLETNEPSTNGLVIGFGQFI